MVGTNDLKLNSTTDDSIIELYRSYKTKIKLIRKYNPKCKLFVCPVLPTKCHNKNRKVNLFNDFLFSDLRQTNFNVTIIEGFQKFFDRRSNKLDLTYAKQDPSDELHLDFRGIRLLVSLIKNAIFAGKGDKSRVGRQLFSNTLRGSPINPT